MRLSTIFASVAALLTVGFAAPAMADTYLVLDAESTFANNGIEDFAVVTAGVGHLGDIGYDTAYFVEISSGGAFTSDDFSPVIKAEAGIYSMIGDNLFLEASIADIYLTDGGTNVVEVQSKLRLDI